MILTVNNDPTKRVTSADVKALAECDDARSYPDAGWYCLIGYKGKDRVVHAHANSEAEFLAMAASMGYRWTGFRMVEMTREERREHLSYAKGGRFR